MRQRSSKRWTGVTSALELEVGAGHVDRWYAQREGKPGVKFLFVNGVLVVTNGQLQDVYPGVAIRAPF